MILPPYFCAASNMILPPYFCAASNITTISQGRIQDILLDYFGIFHDATTSHTDGMDP